MKIQVFGTGCPRCRETLENARSASEQLGMAVELEKVDKIQDIMKAGVVSTPALAVDGDIKIAGRVPSIEEVKKLLSE